MLDTTVLYDALVKLGTPPTPLNPADAANRLAAAYDEYARGAMALTVPMTATGAEVLALSGCLLPAMAPLLGNPLTLATAFDLGVTAYWVAGAGTAFVGGTTAPPLTAGALTTTLLPILSVPMQPVETWAAAMAAALHTSTSTVVVTFPGTPLVTTKLV